MGAVDAINEVGVGIMFEVSADVCESITRDFGEELGHVAESFFGVISMLNYE